MHLHGVTCGVLVLSPVVWCFLSVKAHLAWWYTNARPKYNKSEENGYGRKRFTCLKQDTLFSIKQLRLSPVFCTLSHVTVVFNKKKSGKIQTSLMLVDIQKLCVWYQKFRLRYQKVTWVSCTDDGFEHDQNCCEPTWSCMTNQDSSRCIKTHPCICLRFSAIHHNYNNCG